MKLLPKYLRDLQESLGKISPEEIANGPGLKDDQRPLRPLGLLEDEGLKRLVVFAQNHTAKYGACRERFREHNRLSVAPCHEPGLPCRAARGDLDQLRLEATALGFLVLSCLRAEFLELKHGNFVWFNENWMAYEFEASDEAVTEMVDLLVRLRLVEEVGAVVIPESKIILVG